MVKVLLTPRELALAIGASESSVKRWVDSGHIEAARTAGGHRRIPIQEAARYIREKSLTLVRPEVLGLSELDAASSVGGAEDDVSARFFDFLRSGAEAEARGLILAQYLEGISVAEIVDGPFRTAMARIGEIWTHEPSGIFCEHRATQIAMHALARLRALLNPPPDAPFAVGGAPSGDRYILPSMAVATVLESEGVRAVNLGAETPLASLVLGLEDLDARLAWLSVSDASNPATLRAEILDLVPTLETRRAPLVIGGSQAKSLALPKHDMIYVGGSMVELSALVKGMQLAPAARTPAPV